jgi:hypothetical protein
MLVLLLLPALAFAQVRRGGRGMGGDRLQSNVIQMIIEHKDQLALTSDQLGKLEPISKKLDEQNKPLIEELQKNRPGDRRNMTEEQRQALREPMEKIRDNREAALKEARQVLTTEQQEKLRQVMEEMRPRRGGRGGLRR